MFYSQIWIRYVSDQELLPTSCKVKTLKTTVKVPVNTFLFVGHKSPGSCSEHISMSLADAQVPGLSKHLGRKHVNRELKFVPQVKTL
jgi:hypothetical protein